jgi:hypothetical protein
VIPLRKVGRILVLAGAAFGIVILTLFALDGIALRKLQRQLGYNGPRKDFPIAYFRQRVREGMTIAEVQRALDHSARIRFFMVPIIGTADSSIVQRFEYPLTWRSLNADVHYRRGLVWDVETGGYGMRGASEVGRARAEFLLDSLSGGKAYQDAVP